jgi:phosphoribosylaminoimidazole-succinocarboxamide synthase
VVLVDEVLSPDSSRFWRASAYEPGREQESFDKQYLRNWLTSQGLKGKEGVEMPQEVVAETGAKYKEIFEVSISTSRVQSRSTPAGPYSPLASLQ